MAISKNGLTIFALLVTLIILETDNVIEFSSPALPVHHEEQHSLPHTREKRNALLAQVEYTVDVELNVTELKTVDDLRSLLNSSTFSLALSPTLNITHIDITTVCYPNGSNFQCRCEDQYVWSYRSCSTYGACDEITDDTCGCVNSIPSDGLYCQPKKVPPVVYEYQIVIEVNTTDADQLRNTLKNITFPVQIRTQINISAADITTVCSPDGSEVQCRCEDHYLWPCDKCATYGKCDGDADITCGCIKAIPTDGQYCQSIHHQNFSVCPLTTSPPTAPPVLYEYLTSVELNISDAALINQLRTILSNISYPITIENHTQISDIDISTVCFPSSGGFQCRCEDQYRWSCDQCFLYGPCDNITGDTCGCINAIPPDRQYCKSADQHNFTACPHTTTPSPTNSLTTAPPVLSEYLISVELNISGVAVINQLRTILSNISYPVSIDDHTQISDINISTVCYPNGTTYQCRCEDQYRWPCHMCSTFGKCDNTIDNTCSCINAIPPDGSYCQTPSDLFICPSPTPPNDTATTQTTTLLTTLPTVITDTTPVYTTVLYTTTPTTVVTNTTPVGTTDLNTTTPAVATTSAPVSTTDLNTATAATTPVTDVTNTTLVATTDRSTTTWTTTPQTVTNSSLVPTTDRNTTSATTTPTIVTNSTPVAPTDLTTTTAAIPTSTATNSTSAATTDINTTGPLTSPTAAATNSTPVTTTAATPTPAATNSTLNITTPTATPTTAVTNSTPVATSAATPTTFVPTVATTDVDTTTSATTPTAVTNSTSAATTDINTTGPLTSPTAAATNSTPVAPTDLTTTTAATPTPTATNSTLNITTPTATPTAVTNSTPVATTAATPTTFVPTVATTDVDTTTSATTPTAVTNSTSAATTDINTTGPLTSPTAAATNSTPVTPTDLMTTTAATNSTLNITTPTATPTAVTNSTPVATTAATPTTFVPNSTTATNSTPVSTTHMSTTTAATSTPTATNSIPVATTTINVTTTTATSSPTYSPTVATPGVNTTTVTTTPTTGVTTSSMTSQHITVNSTTSEVTSITASTTPLITATTTTHIPTTTTARAITTVSTLSTTRVNTTTPTSSTTTVTTTIPTSSTTRVTTTIPTLSTTRVTTTIPTSSTTRVTTTIPTSSTTRVTTTIPTLSTKRVTTTTPTSSTTTVTTTIPTSSTTRVTTTIPTTTAAKVTTTIPTSSTTRVTTTIPTTTAAKLTTTVPTTSTTRVTSTAVTGFDVEMSIRLDLEYTAELNDATSSEYKDLESKILRVLEEQYKGITGFINVFVKAFREGSVITDFVVQTTEVIADEMADANENLQEAMRPIAPVIGSVTAFYNSSTSIDIPELTYTGNTMTLTCGPPENINLGQISGSEWKFKGLEIKDSSRIKITAFGTKSVLTVNNVILADVGLYECTVKGKVMNFLQKGLVTGDHVKQAPIVRLQSKVNVKCKEGQILQLQCCVQSSYRIQWFEGTAVLLSTNTDNGETYCIKHDYQLGSCSVLQEKELTFTCKVDEPKDYQMTTTVTIFREDITCNDAEYGTGRPNDISSIGCDSGQEGSTTAVCQETGEWTLMMDTCIITQIKELLIDSQDLVVEEVPQFTANLSKTVQENRTEIANSSATISAIVEILNTIANVSTAVGESVMQNVLTTIDVIIGDDARESWAVLNANETHSASSGLLNSLENISKELVGEFEIATPRILLNRTKFDNSFTAELNSSITIDIPNTMISNIFITTITFPTLNNVMPSRNSSFDGSLFNSTSNETVDDHAINAAVVLVQINATIQNVTLSYDKLNNSLSLNPQCVFWNFTLFDNLGAWDDEGCTFVSDINNTVTCNCNHLTSFSVLMARGVPPELKDALDVITYVGVGISLASLVICLIIEGYVWKAITRNSTAFMRHVSIINTALSLLIADICFIIGASIAKNPLENPGEDYEVPVGPCSTATFFMHFFYLALFFWMLVSGLLLFYRTVMVFSHMSKSTMLAIGFSLGYGCPLIIAVITVAVTASGNGYIRTYNACWLNWIDTKALLALVIPALIIVFINILIVIVVLFKMLRRGVGDTAQTDEKHTLVVIARCVIILTPLFGLTWSLGVGTMVSSTNKGIHIAFAFFNSLQGFFILVFGTLLDSKIRSILARRSPTSSTVSNPSRSTSGGISSLGELNWISRLRGRRYIYRLSEAANSSSSGALESFVSL
ncbi:uncharacterized protein LOC143335878 isoform X4 [Chaetodon auriga]|uniref:uncharacterized protein LOC143335878 isoform X4 n=1 Tax=Chaetodon auriga TaxID=39042 RepID=UPI0040329501